MENIQFFSLEPELSEEMEGYKGEEWRVKEITQPALDTQ